MFNFSTFFKKFPKKNLNFIKTVIIFLFVFTLYFSFGLHHLTNFFTADEGWWLYKRIPQYWNSVETGNLEGTMINDKPGVSVALITAPGYYLNKKSINESLLLRPIYPYKRVEQQDLNIKKNIFSLRFSILLFNGIFSLVLFWLIKKITKNFWVAFWSWSLMLLSPILLGISQIVNPDSLLWIFSTGAIFSFLLFLRERQKKIAVVSSICLGLALLSKYSATILYPFFSLLSFAYIIYKVNEWKKDADFFKKVQKTLVGCLSIIVGSIAIFSLFMPAVFKIKGLLAQSTFDYPGMRYFFWPLVAIQIGLLVDAKFFKCRFIILCSKFLEYFIKKFEKVLYVFFFTLFIFVLAYWISKYDFLNLKSLRFDMGIGFKKFVKLDLYKKIILEAVPLVFSLTPLALFSVMLFLGKSVFKKAKFNFFTFACTAFFVVFYAAVIFENLQVTIRYSIILYPLIMLLAGMGINEIFSIKGLQKTDKFFVSLILIVISGISLWMTKPYYFNYISSLLPKEKLITGAWGYGGYEAAEFINNQPNPEKIVTWSDYPGVCEFTIGPCYQTNRIENKDIDYFVLTRRGRINYPNRGDKTGAKEYYKKDNPVWYLYINNRPGNYVKVYKNEKIDK